MKGRNEKVNGMTTPQPSTESELGQVFVALADSLVTGYDVVELMQRLVDTCVQLLHCDAAGLLLADENAHLRVMAASSEQMHMLELLEVQNEGGPCLECFRSGQAIWLADLRETRLRWPHFTDAAIGAGYLSAQALPLRLRTETIGALNLLYVQPSTLLPSDTALAQALADVATIGILQQRALQERELLTGQLQAALQNRIVIEQAKGVLAESGRLTIDQAFDALRRYSRSHRLPITRVAAELTAGRLRPGAITGPGNSPT